jgi:hypothetical protein
MQYNPIQRHIPKTIGNDWDRRESTKDLKCFDLTYGGQILANSGVFHKSVLIQVDKSPRHP